MVGSLCVFNLRSLCSLLCQNLGFSPKIPLKNTLRSFETSEVNCTELHQIAVAKFFASRARFQQNTSCWNAIERFASPLEQFN